MLCLPAGASDMRYVGMIPLFLLLARCLDDCSWGVDVLSDSGDERPCQRCIKRGLQDACHDGIRKKAKYLHDAPAEAVWPSAGDRGLYSQHAPHHFPPPTMPPTVAVPNPSLQDALPVQRIEPVPQDVSPHYLGPQPFSNLPSSEASPLPIVHHPQSVDFQRSIQHRSDSPALMVSSQQPPPNAREEMSQAWSAGLETPSDPAIHDFDLASMNFGNHYGALEFGMLGHMATGAAPADSREVGLQSGAVGFFDGSSQGPFVQNPAQQIAYQDTAISEWPQTESLNTQSLGPLPASAYGLTMQTTVPEFRSSESMSSPPQGLSRVDSSPSTTYQTSQASTTPAEDAVQASQPSLTSRHAHPSAQITSSQPNSQNLVPNTQSKRRRNPSSIYNSVMVPYSYTSGFHSLIAYLQRRFASSPSKTLVIARSLASIRPSFLATTKTLNYDDLIFMEKCFQRTLWEYERFIEGVGTPTIVARRTGEIAAVGKEFCILTGWRKDILLGRAPNYNVNQGDEAAPTSPPLEYRSGNPSTRSDNNTPHLQGRSSAEPGKAQELRQEGAKTHPVFLAELLDDDSVIEFYEGFSRLAFGDSRGSVKGRAKLLKYRTQEDMIAQSLRQKAAIRGVSSDASSAPLGNATMVDVSDQNGRSVSYAESHAGSKRPCRNSKQNSISNEREMNLKLGDTDGKVDCTICWTVKRDVFDIPMLIVMNVSCFLANCVFLDTYMCVLLLPVPALHLIAGIQVHPRRCSVLVTQAILI